MEKQTPIATDTLFLGLTRPAMVAGVTFSFFIINAMASIITFLASGNIFMLFVALPIHFVGYIICMRDPRVFDILFVKFQKCLQCRNRRVYGANSYDPY